MDKLETLGRIAQNEAQKEELIKEIAALRDIAVKNGWAQWTFTVRQSAPSLKWWKVNRPTVWKKYATTSQVKKFSVNA
tara:strand:+ start:165 stop:398 length:234 start_codon:yes stop_codon:yes gene_type:complete